MTTKKIIAGLLIATSFFTISCSKDDNPSPQSNQQGNEKPSTDEKLFVYKAYVEDLTGTWCGYCPRVIRVLEHIKKNLPALNERIVPVAVHLGGRSGYDPMDIEPTSTPIHQYYKVDKKDTELEISGFPHFALNRNRALYHTNAIENLDEFLKTKKTSPIGIKIESKLTENNGTVSVTFNFKENFQNLKYSVFVVEDGYAYDQRNYTQFYSGGWLQNFEHNDVLRGIYGNALGNDLGSVSKNTEVKKENLQVTYNLLNAKKLENTRIVVFVSDANNNVLNVQEAKANKTKEYQYAN